MVRPALPLAFGMLSALGVAAVSHAASAAPFKRVAQTAHASYYAAGGAKVDVRRSDAFLEGLLGLFGPAPRGWRVQYYRHASVSSLATQIGYQAFGVTDLETSRIDSTYEYHPHELVHAVAGRLGRPPLLFTEGLAVALTSRGSWRGRDLDSVAREYLAGHGALYPMLREFALEDPDRDYAVTGSFVGFLLDRYGADPVIALLEGCGSDATRYERALRDAYGKGLADLEREWSRSLGGSGTPAARAWYEPSSWPGSLRSHRQIADRAPVVSIAVVQPDSRMALERATATVGNDSPASRP